jgi:putative salt-induced outer membrane protein YdiY
MPALVFLLACSACAWGEGDGGPYLNAPGPRIFRLPPVEDAPAADEEPDDPAGPAADEHQPTEAKEEIPPPPPDDKQDQPETGEKSGSKDEKEEIPQGLVANSVLIPEPFLDYWKKWDASIEFGLLGTEGNTRTFNLRAGGKAERKTGVHLHKLEFTHIDNSKDNVKTALSTLIDGRWERKFGKSRWNYFAHSLVEFDEFKAFDVRISADSGLGFEWFKTDAARLLTRLGASGSHEIGGTNDDYIPEISSGVEWKHKLSDRQKIFAQVDYFPNVMMLADFRLNTRADWEIIVSRRWGLSLKTSVIDRYDSTPEGARPNDLNYSLLMLWSL